MEAVQQDQQRPTDPFGSLSASLAADSERFMARSRGSSSTGPVALPRYVHRVGRTARMGHAGEAVLFLLPSEAPGYLQLLGRHAVRLRALPLPPVLGELDDPEGAMVRLRPPCLRPWQADCGVQCGVDAPATALLEKLGSATAALLSAWRSSTYSELA